MSTQPLVTIEDLNRISIERTITGVDPLRTPPATPDNISATSRTFGVLVQWSRVEGCDGYTVLVSDDQDFESPIDQIKVVGESALSYTYPTGNVAVTRYFAVTAYSGDMTSEKTAVVSAASTSAEPLSNSESPANTTFTSAETTIATNTLTTSGKTILIIGRAAFRDDDKSNLVTFRLKEDGATIDTLQGVSLVTAASTYGFMYTCFNFSTPAAGSHTYTLTAQNDSNAETCNANSIQLIACEIPFLTAQEINAAPSEPPSIPQSPPAPDYIPIGPGYGFPGR